MNTSWVGHPNKNCACCHGRRQQCGKVWLLPYLKFIQKTILCVLYTHMKIHQNMAAVWLDLVARLVPGDKFVISHLGPVWLALVKFNSRHIECLDTYIEY